MLADKIQLHQAAATLTASVVAHLGVQNASLTPSILTTIATKLGIDPVALGPLASGRGSLPIDPTIADPQTRSLDLEVAELQRIFYHWLVGCVNDSSWPDPANPAIAPAAPAATVPAAPKV